MKNLISHFNLAQKFFIFAVAAAILPLIALSAGIYWISITTLEKQLQAPLQSLACSQINRLGDETESIEALLSEFQNSPAWDGALSANSAVSSQAYGDLSILLETSTLQNEAGLAIILPRQIQAQFGRKDLPLQVEWFSEWFASTPASEVAQWLTQDKWIYALHRVEIPPPGADVLLVAGIPAQTFENILSTELSSAGYHVLNRNGTILLKRPSETGYFPLDIALNELPTTGTKTIDSYNVTVCSNKLGWRLVLAQPKGASFLQQNTFIRFFLMISLVILALLAWLTWLMNKRLLQPIRRMTNGLQSIQNDPPDEIKPLNDNGLTDEVGNLVRGYNQFLDVLRSTNRRDAALRQSEERYSLAIRGANDGIWDWDLRENFCYFSPRWRYMLGYTEESVRNTPSEWFTRVHPDDLDELKADINTHLDGNTPHFENEHRLRHANGTYIWVLARGLALLDEQEKKAYRFAGSISDISTRKAYETRLLHDAMHDPLTLLPNRAFFIDILENALARAHRREDYHAGILYIDLDHFKLVNDNLGHAAGDQLLVEITQRLKRCLRNMDTVARFSGDEFALLLEEVNGLHDAIQIARRIIQELSVPITISAQEVVTNASIGIVMITRSYQDASEILRDADTAMYQAKANGRGRYEIFDKEMHAYTLSKLRLENELRSAIKNQEFKVYYQPIVSAENGEILYVEALLRWQHPEKGLIATETFIPLAEESGLINNLNRWVLKAACMEARVWYDNGFDNMRVSVNISPRLLLSPDLSDMVRSILADSELPSEALQLEITESNSIYNSGIAIQNLFELTSIGVHICLDDYGLVPSSLEQLKRLPVHTIKISQSFIKDLPTNSEDAAISEAIISMTHILGMQAIGTGIENQQQMQYLIKKGCDYLQGYLFARPTHREDFINFLLEEGTNLKSRFNC